MNQKFICALDFLLESTDRIEEVLEDTWDLVIVDEAHHLEWSEDDASAEWEVVKLISEHTRGLLLLTATPANHGVQTEFGLLNLVDPERFPELSKFQKEESGMHRTAVLAKKISAGDRDPKFIKELRSHFKSDADLLDAIRAYAEGARPDDLLRRLIDCHGTGRVLIRNRRSRLKGFPERKFMAYPIPAPKEWRGFLGTIAPDSMEDGKVLALAAGLGRLFPKGALAERFHARAAWLLGLLKKLNGEKVLLICSSAKRATDLQAWLRTESAIRTAVFHEGLEIVERDRQAAWFAENEGAQVLLCSEIGGEGRNFQFAHHLILFDLPLHPDILEQRIGRLDRIGQRERIQIHVPYIEDTPEEVCLRWYADGLESFTQPWNAGDAVDPLRAELAEACRAFLPKSKQHKKRADLLKKLIESTHKTVKEVRLLQKESEDILVDLNSFDEPQGKALAKRIHAVDKSSYLRDFMDRAFDHFGVEVEDFGKGETVKISTHSLTFVENFPGLTLHGEKLITYDRDQALAREELDFMTYDHSIAQGALSLVIEGDTGTRVRRGLDRAATGESGRNRAPLCIASDGARSSRGGKRSAFALVQDFSDPGRGNHPAAPGSRRRGSSTDSAESDREDDG